MTEKIDKNTLKTSEEWSKTVDHIEVLDPDGWDRQNFDFSWNKELITEREFFKRVASSTVRIDQSKEKSWPE